MKSFDRKLQDFLNGELGADLEISFLHCNAHFLLGLSDSCEKAFKKIGRDKHPQISRFASDGETCVGRLIRTLCDVLGSRGDKKMGVLLSGRNFVQTAR